MKKILLGLGLALVLAQSFEAEAGRQSPHLRRSKNRVATRSTSRSRKNSPFKAGRRASARRKVALVAKNANLTPVVVDDKGDVKGKVSRRKIRTHRGRNHQIKPSVVERIVKVGEKDPEMVVVPVDHPAAPVQAAPVVSVSRQDAQQAEKENQSGLVKDQEDQEGYEEAEENQNLGGNEDAADKEEGEDENGGAAEDQQIGDEEEASEAPSSKLNKVLSVAKWVGLGAVAYVAAAGLARYFGFTEPARSLWETVVLPANHLKNYTLGYFTGENYLKEGNLKVKVYNGFKKEYDGLIGAEQKQDLRQDLQQTEDDGLAFIRSGGWLADGKLNQEECSKVFTNKYGNKERSKTICNNIEEQMK